MSPKYCVGDRVMTSDRSETGTILHVWASAPQTTYQVKWDAVGLKKSYCTIVAENAVFAWWDTDCNCGAKASGQPGHSHHCRAGKKLEAQACTCTPLYGVHAYHCPQWGGAIP